VRVRALLTVAGIGLLATACATGSGAGPAPGTPRPSAEVPGQPGGSCSPAVQIDGFSDALDKTTFADTYVGNLSGLAVNPDGSIAALSDRSSLFTLDARTHRPIGVVGLADESGKPLDSEGLVLDRDGTLLITSEVEPSVRRYTRDGKLLGNLPVPDSVRVAPAGRATRNLTFEGLALQPDGRTLIASMEAALAGDQGNLVRFPTWTRDGGTDEFRLGVEYSYPVDPALGVSELTPTGDGRLLVLERGYVPSAGNTIRLYLADLAQATDVREVRDLTDQPPVRLIHKTLLADLVNCPSLGATAREQQANPLLDNIEGMTITSRDADGGLRLLLVSDDNQNGSQTTRLYSVTAHLPTP